MKPQLVTEQDMTGSAPEEILLDPAYTQHQVVFNGDITDTKTIEAKSAFGDDYEAVEDGSIDIPEKRTIFLREIQLAGIMITSGTPGAFSVTVISTKPVEPL